MPVINVLPKSISDLIAAGEVVESPASVIKEFVENSIDAAAKRIVVEINCGGKTFIRVTDDGCGIEKGDVRNAFLSHATSKIKTADDLDRISTLGFRGEALASVSAVSRTEMLTKPRGVEFGTHYITEGGEEVLFDDAGCPDGTTLIVRDLFYNVPARMKFLKKDVQEGNRVAQIMERVAVSHPEISFRFIRDGKLQFVTPGDGELKTAVYAVFGKEFSESLVPVDYSQDGISVSGLTSKPAYGKNSRSQQIFFVNGRYVKIPLFITALEAAYKNSMLVGKYPPCVLFVTMPYSAVDVNVHPAKTEVRFSDDKRVFDCIYRAALGAVSADVSRPQVNFSKAKVFALQKETGEQLSIKTVTGEESPEVVVPPKKSYRFLEYGSPVTGSENTFRAPEKDEKTFDFLAGEYMTPKESVRTYSVSFSQNESSFDAKEELPKEEQKTSVAVSTEEEKEEAFSYQYDSAEKTHEEHEETEELVKEKEPLPDFRIIGEAFKTYIFAELQGKLLLVDKHAAHERILFNKLKSEAEVSQQMLLQPIAVTLSLEDYDAVLQNLSLLYDAGYDVSDFGNRTVKVSACPVELVGENLDGIINEIAHYLSQNIRTVMPEKLDWIYHSTACRAAVKAGNDTSLQEMEQLIKYLLAHDEIKCCPHGRPVAVEISKYELEKYFKRIV